MDPLRSKLKSAAQQYLVEACIPKKMTKIWMNFHRRRIHWGVWNCSLGIVRPNKDCMWERMYFKTFRQEFVEVYDHVTTGNNASVEARVDFGHVLCSLLTRCRAFIRRKRRFSIYRESKKHRHALVSSAYDRWPRFSRRQMISIIVLWILLEFVYCLMPK